MFLERYGRVLRIRRGRGCCEEWRDLTCTSATIRFDANEPSISPRKFSSCLQSTPEIHIQIYICTYSLYLLFYFHTSHVKTLESNDAQKVPFRNASVIRQGKFRERDGGEKNIRTASDGFKVTGGSVDIFRERGGEYIYIYVYISIRLEGGRSRRDNLAMFLFLYYYPTIYPPPYVRSSLLIQALTLLSNPIRVAPNPYIRVHASLRLPYFIVPPSTRGRRCACLHQPLEKSFQISLHFSPSRSDNFHDDEFSPNPEDLVFNYTPTLARLSTSRNSCNCSFAKRGRERD